MACRQPQLHRKLVSDWAESLYGVLWLWVKLVGALVMENRCGNGLVLPLYPPAASPAVMKNNGFIPGGRDPPPPAHPPPPPLVSTSLQRLCWQANRWLARVASGLCALSVIKEREKVYGLLVSMLPTDGMSSKHPPIPNLQRDWGGNIEGVGVGCNLPFREPSSVLNDALCTLAVWLYFWLNIYDVFTKVKLHEKPPRWSRTLSYIARRSLVWLTAFSKNNYRLV